MGKQLILILPMENTFHTVGGIGYFQCGILDSHSQPTVGNLFSHYREAWQFPTEYLKFPTRSSQWEIIFSHLWIFTFTLMVLAFSTVGNFVSTKMSRQNHTVKNPFLTLLCFAISAQSNYKHF